MLNRLSSVLQSAADALAPPPPPLEDLKYHWKMVMRFYAQRTIQSKCPIEETNIPSHLEQLLKILIAEDTSTKATTEGPCTSAGPCLEFLLQHRLLELLVSLARADSPPGMRRYLLGYLRRLVAAISPHLLTLASIHLPLLRIVVLCSQSKASPTEAEEIQFLLALCQIIHKQPYLSIIFNKETKANKGSGSSSSACSTALGVTSPAHEHSSVKSSEQVTKQMDETGSPVKEINTQKVSPEPEILSTLPSSEKGLLNQSPKPEQIDESKNGPYRNENDLSHIEILEKNKNANDQASARNCSSSLNESIALPTMPEDNIDCGKEGTGKECSSRHEEVLSDLSRTTSGSCTPEPFLVDDLSDTEIIDGNLPLLDAVLSFINSPDSVTKLHVCEAILMLVSVADDTFSGAIARTSNLALVMAEKLTSSFQEIPSDTDPDHLENIPQNWGPKSSQLWLEHHAFPGCRLVASFVSWLNFCDQLTVESPYEIAESVAGAVRALFFEIELESELRTGDVVRQQLITNIICLSLRHISSNILLSELHVWLMGDTPEDTESEVISLRQLLLNNCLHSEMHLSLSSMRLFELLLENCDEHVLNCLVLRYLEKRAYYDLSSQHDKSCMESWSDEEDAREQVGAKSNLGQDSGGSSSRTFAPSNIHKIIDSFLQLLPSSLRSATDYQESGYHQYIAEAQRQYAANIQICSTMGWSTEATFPEEEKSSTNKPFNEGPFLQMIFERLRGLPRQPYEMNLQLTALVSRLAILPHPYLHEFLLNPLLPLVPGTTSLYSTLQAVAKEMQASVAPIHNCKKMLVRTRHELLEDMSYNQELTRDGSCLFESIVVLEELNKELAAIVYVKYHHSS